MQRSPTNVQEPLRYLNIGWAFSFFIIICHYVVKYNFAKKKKKVRTKLYCYIYCCIVRNTLGTCNLELNTNTQNNQKAARMHLLQLI